MQTEVGGVSLKTINQDFKMKTLLEIMKLLILAAQVYKMHHDIK